MGRDQGWQTQLSEAPVQIGSANRSKWSEQNGLMTRDDQAEESRDVRWYLRYKLSLRDLTSPRT